MQWHTQARSITTILKVDVDFTLPALGVTNVVTCKSHADDFVKCEYDMFLRQYILTKLIINLKISEQVIEADY